VCDVVLWLGKEKEGAGGVSISPAAAFSPFRSHLSATQTVATEDAVSLFILHTLFLVQSHVCETDQTRIGFFPPALLLFFVAGV